MLSILEKLRCVRMTFPAFACVVKSVRQIKPTVSRERPLRDSYFRTVAGSYWPVGARWRGPARALPRLYLGLLGFEGIIDLNAEVTDRAPEH